MSLISTWPPIEIIDNKTGKVVVQLWMTNDQTYILLDELGMSREVSIYSYNSYEAWKNKYPE